MTWGYFGVAHLAGAFYGRLVAHDMKMVIVFTSNFLACSTVVGLVTWKKRAHARHLIAVQTEAATQRSTAIHLSPETALAAAKPTVPTASRHPSRALGEFPQA